MDLTNQPQPTASVVVVTWNAMKYVRECLLSLQAEETVSVEVIVVDNNSSDGTAELIQHEFPHFKLIRNSDNHGFSKANNVGIEQAHGKYICLVNSDVVVLQGCLEKLLLFMEDDPQIGLLGPQMVGPEGEVRRSCMRRPSIFNCLTRALALDRLPLLSRALKSQMMSDFAHNQIQEVDVLNGWFWVVRREALASVGPLDERFFIYAEDLDWSYRFREAGWKVMFYPEAAAIHYGGASSSAAPVRFCIEMQKAEFQYWQKHYSPWICSIHRAIVFLHHGLRFLGHSLLYSVNVKRVESGSKARQSWALLSWMLTGRQPKNQGPNDRVKTSALEVSPSA